MASLINALITLLTFAIFGRVIMDWLIVGGVVRHDSQIRPLRDVLIMITEPILAPLRRYTRIGMVDLSPMAAIIILSIIGQVLS
ncbi:MAG: YggT family protein [Dehalococcoidia bacterium]|jgi:uncharacterized protein YggT (Ycf19 family)|nr:YggT family protein [Dehalococcoidia bacterium]